MKRYMFILAILLLAPFLFFFSAFAFKSGDHHYKRDDFFSWWLYTPNALKDAPQLSTDMIFSYSYDIDHQETIVSIQYKNIKDITKQEQKIFNFINKFKGISKYNCSWVYKNHNDYSNEYQRYCVYKKGNTLELEFFEIAK